MRTKPIPPKGSRPEELQTFLETVIRYDTSHRIERFTTWEQARHYYEDDQWLERDYTEDPTRSPFWKSLELDVDNWMPTPVQNEMVRPIRNEVSRLLGVGSRPYIRVDKETPEAAKGAKLAKDVLNDRLEKLHWYDVQYEGCHHMVLYGTWVLKSSLELDYTEMKNIPVEETQKCPDCGAMYVNANIPDASLEEYKDNKNVKVSFLETEVLASLEEPRASGKITGCLACGTPLEGYTPAEEELDGPDYLGRPLGKPIPTVETQVRTCSVYDSFPENSGLDLNMKRMEEFGEAYIRSIDWCRKHFANGHLVKPEVSFGMLRWHPIVGGSRHFYGSGEGSDPALFDHHAMVWEWHKKPWIEYDEKTKERKLNRGRSIIIAGNPAVVLLDGDYMIESKLKPGKLIPRVHYEYIPWELRDREMFGISASEWMFSDQDSINTRKSQVEYARHIFGNPKLFAPEGCELTSAGMANTGYSSDIWTYRPGPAGEKPEALSGMQLGQAWVTEASIDLDAINRRIGVAEIEGGDAPKDVTAASALMYLGEKSAETRKPRIQRIREAKKRIYSHQLELIHEFYRDERFYHVQDQNDKWGVKAFKGTDLANQTNVQLEDEAVYDERMFRRESIKEGIELGTIIPDSAAAKRKVNKALDIPLDVNETQNLQVSAAEDEWLAYVEEQIAPAVKPRQDYHAIHFQAHDLAFTSEIGKKYMRQADWNQVCLAIEGWEKDFEQILEMEASLELNPPSPEPPVPMPDPLTGVVSPDAHAHAVMVWQSRIQAKQQIDAMPRAMELRILQVKKNLLAESGVEIGDERAATIDFLLRFDAHIEAHYRLAKGQAEAAATGEQIPAAPGGVESPSGMLPEPAMPTVAGAGAGQGGMTASGSGAGLPQGE
jgi:hypothetical protein